MMDVVTVPSVNVIGLLGLGDLFAAHVTGNLVILAAHLVTGGTGANPVCPGVHGGARTDPAVGQRPAGSQARDASVTAGVAIPIARRCRPRRIGAVFLSQSRSARGLMAPVRAVIAAAANASDLPARSYMGGGA
jgi:hypothetical protein